jgi:hypothetical protein
VQQGTEKSVVCRKAKKGKAEHKWLTTLIKPIPATLLATGSITLKAIQEATNGCFTSRMVNSFFFL